MSILMKSYNGDEGWCSREPEKAPCPVPSDECIGELCVFWRPLKQAEGRVEELEKRIEKLERKAEQQIVCLPVRYTWEEWKPSPYEIVCSNHS